MTRLKFKYRFSADSKLYDTSLTFACKVDLDLFIGFAKMLLTDFEILDIEEIEE